jgi:protocatechuate 3,4-dioxygenase beta subunit
MDTDDRQVGRILTRREVLALFGAVGTALLVGCGPQQGAAATAAPAAGGAASPVAATTAPIATAAAATAAATALAPAAAATGVPAPVPLPACVVRPALTEGPYYVNEELNRSDIRSDPATGAVKEGVPLVLTFNVAQVTAGGCTALPGAKVEIWHCDALGVYSDVSDPSFNTRGQQFLRGYQLTDANGQATFTTIYPGWYPGRTVHIHFKIRPSANAEFTSQLFFDDALSDQVFARQPYAAKGVRGVRNGNDTIFNDELVLTIAPSGQGYAATFDIGVQV